MRTLQRAGRAHAAATLALPAILGALALMPAGSPAGAAAASGPATPPPTPSPTTTTPKPRAPSRPRRRAAATYRPIGCVRRGPAIAYSGGPRQKVVALSFDDGPWPDTGAFLRMLEAHHAVATLFMIGEQVTARYRATLRRELGDGDALGDHTYTHPMLTATGGVYGQLQQTLFAIRRLTGYTPCVFRPPYGAYDRRVIETARSLGLATILWNVDPADWALPGTGAIEQRVLAQVQPGSIILSHDGGGPRGETLAAYPRIIETLRARGYRLETIPELLGFKTVYRRCLKQCEGMAVHGPLPPGSIVLR